jgi:hypothetical protein
MLKKPATQCSFLMISEAINRTILVRFGDLSSFPDESVHPHRHCYYYYLNRSNASARQREKRRGELSISRPIIQNELSW